ncbi:MAG: nuclease-related domain-containing protein [Eubacteriales bacterium]|nr:nuclease-related domain-containing protein [Eubacteriales bacterium]
MAKIYHRHRYHGAKLLGRKVLRQLVSVSQPLAFVLAGAYLLLPWLKQLEPMRPGLLAIAVLSVPAAFVWRARARKLATAMDIMAAGHDGEGTVARLLAKLPREWAVLNNLALRAGGPIVQIDHLVISPSGVFVLETKAQKGKIIPCAAGKWQVERRGQIRSIVNPVQQNQAQVKACQLLLDRLKPGLACKGLVVMTESMAQADWPIVAASDLRQCLLAANSGRKQAMSKKEIRRLAKGLMSFQVEGKARWQEENQYFLTFALTLLLPLFLFGAIAALALNQA